MAGRAPLPLTRVCLSVGDDRARTLSLGHTLSSRSCSIWEGEAHRGCRARVGGAGQRWGDKQPEPCTEAGAPPARDYLAFLIADPPVELLPLQAQEVLPRLDDAALGRDGPGRVDVVSSHHADRDASTLAFADGLRDLEETRESLRPGPSVSGLFPLPLCHPDVWHPPPIVVPKEGIWGRHSLSPLLPGPQRAGCLLRPPAPLPNPGACFTVLGPRTGDDSDPGLQAPRGLGDGTGSFCAVEGAPPESCLER